MENEIKMKREGGILFRRRWAKWSTRTRERQARDYPDNDEVENSSLDKGCSFL